MFGLFLAIIVVVCIIWWIQQAPISIPPILKWIITGVLILLLIGFLYENMGEFHFPVNHK